jgi:hypothetical protein
MEAARNAWRNAHDARVGFVPELKLTQCAFLVRQRRGLDVDIHPAKLLVLAVLLALLLRGAAAAPIPVLCYHQMNSISYLSVTSAELGRQMDALRARGYDSITPQQYAQWMRGNTAGLPPKPVLITFDDGIANALPALGIMRARGYVGTMFAVSGFADTPDDWSMDWGTLTQLRAAGWSIQLHGGPDGHDNIQGQFCDSYLACRLPGESAAAYQARVVNDLTIGDQALRSRGLISAPSAVFAVPFDDWGIAVADRDAVPANFLQSYFEQRFAAVFHQR